MSQSSVQLPSVVARRIYHPSLGVLMSLIKGGGDRNAWERPKVIAQTKSCVWPATCSLPHRKEIKLNQLSNYHFRGLRASLWSPFSNHIYQPEHGYDTALHVSQSY